MPPQALASLAAYCITDDLEEQCHDLVAYQAQLSICKSPPKTSAARRSVSANS
ncbi:protein of unknown function [Ralstonia solanacearum CFBP2957]|nr:protein of unknown function [Ralstonia solanacearum CFBP2957]